MHSHAHLAHTHATVIERRTHGTFINWRELWRYRDLFFFLALRGIKTRYAQSVIGVGWAVIQPLFSMLVYTVVFGQLTHIDSNGVPYALFSFAALVPWTFFSNALTEGAGSLVANASMISKVYFPRLILPLAAIASKLVDFAIAMAVLALLMAWYGVTPGPRLLSMPLLLAIMILTAVGLSAWLSAMAVQYRDVQHAMGFVVQLLMYAAPVVYPASLVPDSCIVMGFPINPQLVYALNPMVAVIEGFRSALLDTRPMPWTMIIIGGHTAILIAMAGLYYFHRRESRFADLV